MKASELRIGNYVDYEYTTHIISQLNKNIICSYWLKDKDLTDEYVDECCNYKPIPLTEEWLIKFCFEKHEYYKQESYKKGIVEIWVVNGKLEDDYDNEVKSIHQLQNLYFVLTGEELVAEPTRTTQNI